MCGSTFKLFVCEGHDREAGLLMRELGQDYFAKRKIIPTHKNFCKLLHIFACFKLCPQSLPLATACGNNFGWDSPQVSHASCLCHRESVYNVGTCTKKSCRRDWYSFAASKNSAKFLCDNLRELGHRPNMQSHCNLWKAPAILSSNGAIQCKGDSPRCGLAGIAIRSKNRTRAEKELQDSLHQPASRTRRPPTPPPTATRAVPKPKPYGYVPNSQAHRRPMGRPY